MDLLPSTDDGIQDNFYQRLLSLPKLHGTKFPVWEANISTVRSWLQECLNTHECGAAPPSLPARLLAAKDGPIHIEDTHHLPMNTKYCTLNHCWGPKSLPDLAIKKSEPGAVSHEHPRASFLEDFPRCNLHCQKPGNRLPLGRLFMYHSGGRGRPPT